MATAIEWITRALRDHSEVALFLALAAGYLIGRIRIRSFKLGPVVGCLLAGVAIGQFGIVVPGVLAMASDLAAFAKLVAQRHRLQAATVALRDARR